MLPWANYKAHCSRKSILKWLVFLIQEVFDDNKHDFTTFSSSARIAKWWLGKFFCDWTFQSRQTFWTPFEKLSTIEEMTAPHSKWYIQFQSIQDNRLKVKSQNFSTQECLISYELTMSDQMHLTILIFPPQFGISRKDLCAKQNPIYFLTNMK